MAVDGTHATWWNKAVAMASTVGNFVVAINLANRAIDVCCLFKVDTELCMPRVCARQTHRDNAVAVFPSDYFKKAVTIPMLDELCGHLEAEFEKHQQIVAKGLSLIPENIAAHPEKSKLAALAFAEQCQDDFLDGHSLATFSAELNRWCNNAVTSSEKGLKFPSLLVASLALVKSSLSPCIERLLSVIAILTCHAMLL